MTIEFKLEKESLSKIIEFFDQTKKILVLTAQPEKYENLSNKNELSLEIPEIKFNGIECIPTYLSNENNLDILTKKQNYDIIVLDQILEFFDNPIIFLNNISKFLSTNGVIVGCVYNFSNIINRIKFLDGEIPENKCNSKYSVFSLENLLFFLSNSNLKITKLDRIQNEVTLSNQNELKNYVLPIELINSINNDPESQTFFYIFSAVSNSNITPQSRKLISEFSKNLVTEKLNDIFNQIKLEHEKEIIYLKQNNQEQYDLIKHLKQGLSDKDEFYEKTINGINKDKDAYAEQIIKDKDAYAEQINKDKDAYAEQINKDKDAYAEQIIKDKDAYAEQIIKDKDAYAEQIIKDRDEIINSLQQSLAFKIIRNLDKLRGKTVK
jgi:hypothetical protein